jgi:hypothetical protein
VLGDHDAVVFALDLISDFGQLVLTSRSDIDNSTLIATSVATCIDTLLNDVAKSTGLLRLHSQAFERLISDVSNEVEVFVDLQDRQSGEFCGRCDDQVRDGGCAVLPLARQRQLHLDRAVLGTTTVPELPSEPSSRPRAASPC